MAAKQVAGVEAKAAAGAETGIEAGSARRAEAEMETTRGRRPDSADIWSARGRRWRPRGAEAGQRGHLVGAEAEALGAGAETARRWRLVGAGTPRGLQRGGAGIGAGPCGRAGRGAVATGGR
ncbi:hypothetical protein GCM10009533_26530 [Saccharopolyspora spinosporotrichia]|uniref:Uncharacterized protein n=1 Tax=Saccharopolyspora erythraea TaxID=1836 RepID=A0ABP3MUM6_SACER|nr:hypothetical protein N599_06530 [Saccharopolyspora erythraea D]